MKEIPEDHRLVISHDVTMEFVLDRSNPLVEFLLSLPKDQQGEILLSTLDKGFEILQTEATWLQVRRKIKQKAKGWT